MNHAPSAGSVVRHVDQHSSALLLTVLWMPPPYHQDKQESHFCYFRDLKTQNVFLNKAGSTCKLGDFGISKAMDTTIELASTCVGTPYYLAPEMCQDLPYSSKADIWVSGFMLASAVSSFCYILSYSIILTIEDNHFTYSPRWGSWGICHLSYHTSYRHILVY